MCPIIVKFGDLRFADLTTRMLDPWRTELLKKWSIKTTRDVIDSTFRRITRDVLLAWFKGSCPWYYPFVFYQFGTRCRPGEAIGLRLNAVDVRTAKVRIRISRSYGEDNRTKTKKADRTIQLRADVLAVLRGMPTRLAATDRTFLFPNEAGNAIKQEDFVAKYWRRAHVATKVRPRRFYETRATFIHLACTAGCNLKWLAEYTGTSVEMIEQTYGTFMGNQSDELAKLDTLPTPARRPA